jgi:hypothetical protein
LKRDQLGHRASAAPGCADRSASGSECAALHPCAPPGSAPGARRALKPCLPRAFVRASARAPIRCVTELYRLAAFDQSGRELAGAAQSPLRAISGPG